MLTIKHVSASGAHSIYQSPECMYAPVLPGDGNSTNSPTAENQRGFVWYKDGPEIKSLQDGVVYVMNDNGATVAKYELRDDTALPAAA